MKKKKKKNTMIRVFSGYSSISMAGNWESFLIFSLLFSFFLFVCFVL